MIKKLKENKANARKALEKRVAFLERYIEVNEYLCDVHGCSSDYLEPEYEALNRLYKILR